MADIKREHGEYLVCPSPSVECSRREKRTANQFKEDVLAGRVVYEAIYGEMVPTYDYDEKVTDGRDLADAQTAAYKKALQVLRDLWGFKVIIHTLTSTGHKVSDKYTGPFVSFRFLIRGGGKFRCGDDMKRAGKVPEMFDQSIYKKEGRSQLMRVWGASKQGENRPMQYLCFGIPKSLEEANKDPDVATYMFEETLAQYVGDEPLIEVEPDPQEQLLMCVDESGKAVGANGKPFGEDIKIDSPEQIEQLCRIAGWFEQKWEWEEWEYKMWLLRNVANEWNLDLRELAHTISRVSPKYDKATTDKAYDVSANRPVSSTRRHMDQEKSDAYGEWVLPVKRSQELNVAGGDPKLASIIKLAWTTLNDSDVDEQMIAGGWIDDYLWLPDQGKHGTIMKWNGVFWGQSVRYFKLSD